MAVLVVLSSISFAETCAEKSYSVSCNKCTFDVYGKMDQTCYQKYQSSGKACLFGAYPIESAEYVAGACPAVDVCINRLTDCKAIYTSGNDKQDCYAENIDHCFIRADNCVALAVKNCSGTPPGDISDIAPPASFCDGFFFFIFPIFVGAVYYGSKNQN